MATAVRGEDVGMLCAEEDGDGGAGEDACLSAQGRTPSLLLAPCLLRVPANQRVHHRERDSCPTIASIAGGGRHRRGQHGIDGQPSAASSIDEGIIDRCPSTTVSINEGKE